MEKQSNNNTKYYKCADCGRIVAEDFVAVDGEENVVYCGICGMRATMGGKLADKAPYDSCADESAVSFPNADRQARQIRKRAIKETLSNIMDNFLVKALEMRGVTVTDYDTVKEMVEQILLYNTITVEGK